MLNVKDESQFPESIPLPPFTRQRSYIGPSFVSVHYLKQMRPWSQLHVGELLFIVLVIKKNYYQMSTWQYVLIDKIIGNDGKDITSAIL